MIDRIKRMFERVADGRNPPTGPGRHDLRVAACALLVEIARIDETFTEQETDTILEILKARHGVSEENARTLMAEAERELVESVDLWQFARLINDSFSRKEKIGLVETLWQVVFVDGRMDQYEDYLMHKVAKLLRLHHKELMDAKLKVLYGDPT